MRSVHRWWGIRGVLLGLAMVVPGLSGGTVALAGGFYRQLIDALARPRAGQVTPLAMGAAAGVVGGSRIIALALAAAPDHTGALMAGIVIAASLSILHRAGVAPVMVLWFGAGTAAGWTVSGMNLAPAVSVGGQAAAIFIGGLVSSAAMVLPGISGASMLVMVGQYGSVLEALGRWDLLLLAAFVLGAAAGLLTVSRAVRAFLTHWPAATLLFLGGVMLGSARGLWPGSMNPGTIVVMAAGAVAVAFLKGGLGPWKGWTWWPPGGVSGS